jgi:hypothetical protein
MSLKQYIAEGERRYTYRLKTITPLDDNAMDKIERELLKYDPIDISRPRKTMFQVNPLDFTNVRGIDKSAMEVFIVDMELGLPASPSVLAKAFQLALTVPEDHVIVRAPNDPTEVENERLTAAVEIGAEAKKLGLTPSGLLTDPTYSEVTTPADLYGKVHNEKFLDALRAVQKEREAKQKVDATNPLFKWMDMPPGIVTDEGDYNADIPDAPRIGKVSNAGVVNGVIDGVSNAGNLTDRRRTYKRLYGKDGKRTMLSREVDTGIDPK